MNEPAETITGEVLHDRSQASLLVEILGIATRLGLTSFGGPIAHLGYFHEEYVKRRKWVDEQSYAELVALCQSLPGPTSSMVNTAIGFVRAGVFGGLVAWFCFTLPSALALVAFGFGISTFGAANGAGWLHGLKLVAVPVVAQAIWGMARTLCPDRERATMAILTAIVALAWPTAAGQVLPIIAAGFIGWNVFPPANIPPALHVRVPISHRLGTVSWVLFFGLLVALPLGRQATNSQTLAVFDSFYRAGALVFGGGHVVLPLLQAGVVAPGWVTNDQFIAGYGAAQAVPGPLFTFAGYLGAVMRPPLNGWAGAAVALIAIFLPGFLMTLGS
ncbi:MAG TPA: chromate efflux transporter, partial [Candidatus Acidoferrales bacterium]|nr:chromate efflux transporter [Candidatus Acidoferrales bacterium]